MKINGELKEVVLQELLYLHLAVVQILMEHCQQFS